MKITLTKKDKILIGVTILLYVLGFFIGGWGIFPNLLFLFFTYSLFRKSHDKGKFSTFNLIILMVIITLSILIKIGFFLNDYQYYSIKKNFEKQIDKSDIISATPTITQKINNKIIWKTYSSSTMKISFEYPSDLLIGVDDTKIGETKEKVDILYHKIYIGNLKSQVAIPSADGIYAPFEVDFYSNNILIDYAFNKPLNEAKNEFKQKSINSFTMDSLETKNILVDNKTATEYSGKYDPYLAMGDKYHRTVLIETDKGIYLIKNNFIIQEQFFSNDVINKIISSFKFLE